MIIQNKTAQEFTKWFYDNYSVGNPPPKELYVDINTFENILLHIFMGKTPQEDWHSMNTVGISTGPVEKFPSIYFKNILLILVK